MLQNPIKSPSSHVLRQCFGRLRARGHSGIISYGVRRADSLGPYCRSKFNGRCAQFGVVTHRRGSEGGPHY